MNSEQRIKIRELVREFSGSGTESLIAFVAGTDGLLSACQALLHSLDAEGSAGSEWLQQECSREEVPLLPFVAEVRKIVALFRLGQDAENPHAVLGVSPDAGLDEIKHAYRTLSRRYHPDTALPPYRDDPEKFIAINRAYNALMNVNKVENDNIPQRREQWRIKKSRRVSPQQRKKMFIWVSGLLIIMVFVSIIASVNYQKRAMLAGLQSRGAFIPPAGKDPAGSPRERTGPPGEKEKAGEGSVMKTAAGVPDQDSRIRAPSPEELQTSPPPSQAAMADATPPPTPAITAEESPRVIHREERKPEMPGEENQDRPAAGSAPVQVVKSDAVKKTTEPVMSAPAAVAKASSEAAADRAQAGRGDLAGKAGEMAGNRGPGRTAKRPEDSGGIAAAGQAKTVSVPVAQVYEGRAGVIEPEAAFANAKPHGYARVTGAPRQEERRLAAATVEEIRHISEPDGVEAVATGEGRSAPSVAPEEGVVLAGPAVRESVRSGSPTEEASRKEDSLQERVDSFFARYTDAYEQRNLILFTRFFEGQAEENGKPFSSITPTYLDLFAATRNISFRVEDRSCRMVDGLVKVDGRFKVFLEYADNRKVTGYGPIHFLLSENGGEMLIRKMDYVFHSE